MFGATFWPALLLASDVVGVEPGLLAAAGLGAVNAAVGVLVHQVILRIIRRASGRKPVFVEDQAGAYPVKELR